MADNLFGKLFGDRGYVNEALKEQQLEPFDEGLLNQRSLIETVFDELKNLCQIEHSSHRSMAGFTTNLLAGLIAYYWFPYKPTLKSVSAYGQVVSFKVF